MSFIAMLIDNNESVALSNYCIKFVTHHKGQYILNETLYQ